jgi:hypothetical protein
MTRIQLAKRTGAKVLVAGVLSTAAILSAAGTASASPQPSGANIMGYSNISLATARAHARAECESGKYTNEDVPQGVSYVNGVPYKYFVDGVCLP